jgi:hypothetical protein
LFLHTSVVRALSPSLARARGDWAGLVKGGSFHVRWELDGLCGIPGDTPMLAPTRPGLFRVLRSPAQGLSWVSSVRKVLAVSYTVLFRALCMHAP